MDLNTDTGESLLQLEIRKCQQAFAMSSHDEPEEFEDIQFFHRIPPVALSSFKIGGGSSGGGFMSSAQPSYQDGEENFQDSESSYMFPDNVMEYGEPQFFPGNCVGYLETILEETDEDCEEEEGSSGRHWWTPDSDTDTESVIRLESANTPTAKTPTTKLNNADADASQKNNNEQDKCRFVDFFQRTSSTGGGVGLQESLSSPSSPPLGRNPFELEELYLFDQLDLAFEETLMKPRRRAGFAFEAELHLPPFQDPPIPPPPLQDPPPPPTNHSIQKVEDDQSTQFPSLSLEPEASAAGGQSEGEEEDEPAVVNEEDFFCSSSGSSSASEEDDGLRLSETEETSEDSTTTSGSDEEKKSGIVLAEFSLNPPFSIPSGGDAGSEMYTNNHANPHRRSYEAPSKIRSFRSYDSLNSLLGTELLFSPPESFLPAPSDLPPPIAEVQPGQEEDGGRTSSSGGGSRSSSTPEDKLTASRKNSGEASSENLSEDSGIHDLVNHSGRPAHAPSPSSFHLAKPEFALNPFIYSSASEENSLLSSSSTTNYSSSEVIFEVSGGGGGESSTCFLGIGSGDPNKPTSESCEKVVECCLQKTTREENQHLITTTSSTSYITTTQNTTQKRERISTPIQDLQSVNNGEVVVESGPMSTLGSCSPTTTTISTTTTGRSQNDGEIKDNKDFYALTQLISPSLPPRPLTPTGAEGSSSSEIPKGEDPLLEIHPWTHYHHHPSEDKVEEEQEEREQESGRVERAGDADLNPPKEDPLCSNLPLPTYSNNFNPSSSSQTILSSSNFGPGGEENRSGGREEDSGDYVTLAVLCERKGGEKVRGREPSSVPVSPPLGKDAAPGAERNTSGQNTFLEQEAKMEVEEPKPPIPIKTYGGVGNNDVAVYLVTSGSGGSRTPSPTVPIPPGGLSHNEGQAESGSLTKTKTVHFSPVVSEISWRESYAEPQSGDDIDPEPSPPPTAHHHQHQHPPNGHQGVEGPIEKVHVHSQILSQPLPMLIPRSEKERLMALEPTDEDERDGEVEESLGHAYHHGPMSTVVPDLLSQCEPSSPSHHGDEVDASAGSRSTTAERPYYYQQQIFPAMFVASAKEAAEVNQVNLKKSNGKKATYVAPPIVPPSPTGVPPPKPPKGKRGVNEKGNGADPVPSSNGTGGGGDNKEKGGVKSKPGFFQRLSKIRLSGKSAQPKVPKTKIYPKEIEPLNPPPGNKGKGPYGPILKKGSSSSPLVLQNNSPGTPPSQRKNGPGSGPKEHDDACSEAFENILEEIAGLNTILQRQQFPPSANHQPGSGSGKRSFAERKQFLINPEEAVVLGQVSALESKLSQFKEEASRTRDQISRSHPDLETIQGMTARQVGSSPGQGGLIGHHHHDLSSSSPPAGGRGAPGSAESRKNEREWYRLLRSAAEKYYNGGRPGRGEDGGSYKTGIVETDLDTGTSRELLDAELVILDELDMTLGPPPPLPTTPPPMTGSNNGGAKAQSLTNLTTGLKLSIAPHDPSQGIDDEGEERAKSLEFLLDEEQKSAASPPENRLRQDNRQLSEHELRIQRSLQKINVPDWYRRHSTRSKSVERDRDRSEELRKDTPLVTPNGSAALKLLKRTDYGSAGGLAGGWAGLSAYRTPSLSSLQNGGLATGSLNRSNFVRGRPVTMSATRSSRESLLSPSSTASQSPSAFERSSFTYGMPLTLTRYGKGRFSSTSGTSPASSPSSTPGQNAPLSTYVKQPYLGWRSQERLNQAGSPGGPAGTGGGLKLSAYRPPAERLAADMLTRQKKSPVRPTGSERPPLPKWPSRTGSEKTKSLPPPPAETVVVAVASHEHMAPRHSSPTVHDSIREVTDAINEFVSHGSEGPPKPQPRGRHVKKQALWFESSFVGKKTPTQ